MPQDGWNPGSCQGIDTIQVSDWRDTTAPQWQHSRFAGMVTDYTLENIIVDSYLFGVAAVGTDGNESVIVFPSDIL